MGTHKIEIRRRNVEKILLAAEKVFAEKGYAGTSMGNIAEEAELPRSNLPSFLRTRGMMFRRSNHNYRSTHSHFLLKSA